VILNEGIVNDGIVNDGIRVMTGAWPVRFARETVPRAAISGRAID
jgi:hypothetical protein